MMLLAVRNDPKNCQKVFKKEERWCFCHSI